MGVLKAVGFSLLLLLCHLGHLPSGNCQYIFPAEDTGKVEGLQGLWTAWNKTPNPESNLLNWITRVPEETPWPCYDSDKNWRGVTCLRWQLNTTVSNTWMVGLELSKASIVGPLPGDAIKWFSKLVTLSLTGNPKLTGPLPREIGTLPLNILDLQDNGLSGNIPEEISKMSNLLKLDLSGNQFTGQFPVQFMATTTMQEFRIARNKLYGYINTNAFQNMTQLLIVDLSGNMFSGPPPNFTNVIKLNNLNLSYNSFTELPGLSEIFNTWLPKNQLGVLDLSGLKIGGQLPDWNSALDLLSIEQLYLNNISLTGVLDLYSINSSLVNMNRPRNSTLQVLSLMNNSITDVLFDKNLLPEGKIKIFLQGNPYCNDASKDSDARKCFCEQYCTITPEASKSYWMVILITTIVCAFVLGSVIISLVFILHKKNKHVRELQKIFKESAVSAKRYEYCVLRAATLNFAAERKLGEGAYGAVFKGILTNNVEIAVKQLFMKTQQASEDFLNEILLITNLRHRNLVALKGYCLHGKEMLLVYEYVDYCDLDKLLFKASNGSKVWQVVGWPARMNICLGVAQGLYYLHASSQTRIIHRDIKASNILIDKNLNPKIADFGLARPILDERSEIMTQQRVGTLGYLAPEYMLYGQLSEKADVYSFGVLLLELVSGCRNKDPSKPEDDVYLPTRTWRLHKENRLMEVSDPKLHLNQIEVMEVQRVLETAIMCIQSSPEKRPTMFRVVAMLAGDADIVSVPVDETNMWPDYQFPSTTASGEPLLMPPSSRQGPIFSIRRPSVELSAPHTR